MKQTLSRIWEAWKKLGKIMGDLLARVVLTVFYFTIFLPFGLIVSLLNDRLEIKKLKPAWLARGSTEQSMDDARRLF